MQESFNIKSSAGNYIVTIGDYILEDIMNKNCENLFIADKNLKDYISNSIKKIIYVEANETSKSLEEIPKYIKEMKKFNLNRKSKIFSIGGGVVQDISTFSSSIYMRGIKWDYFPTTVLGMVDSCIGGKSAINLNNHKNLVGNFFPPENIYIDLQFIKTLPVDHTIGGIFEAAKICYAKGEKEFLKFSEIINEKKILNNGKINTNMDFKSIILLSLKSKKWFIEIDEFDTNERLLLNFGHTFGHAFESATQYQISHGISVGFGMAVAIEISNQLSLLNNEGKVFSKKMKLFLDNSFSLMSEISDIKIKSFNYEKYISAFNNDKKHIDNNYRVILPTKNGNLELVEIKKDKDILNIINKVSEEYIKKFNFIG